MRHIFIINPAAGVGSVERNHSLEKKIKETCERLSVDYEIHTTSRIGDCTHIAKTLCEEYENEKIRFYACGGDGTLGELASGVIGRKNAEITVIPLGTGNDFVRNFDGNAAFLDIDAQINGSPMQIDAVACGDRISVNFVNTGFDCAVVEKTSSLKKHPLITPRSAYIVGVACELVKLPMVKIQRLQVDGDEVDCSKFLLLAAAGGAYYGGGFNSAPRASIDDGLIDVCIAMQMSRMSFISMVGGYKNGSYINNARTLRHVRLYKCRKLDIVFDGEQSVCFDGEIEKCHELHIEVLPSALYFSLPRGVTYKCSGNCQ